MAVWLAGLLGFIAGWLIARWGLNDELKAAGSCCDYLRKEVKHYETLYEEGRQSLFDERADCRKLESREYAIQQILNGVPLNEVK